MLYINMIAEELNVCSVTARKIMDLMCIGHFHFSSSSKESIIEEAKFIATHSL